MDWPGAKLPHWLHPEGTTYNAQEVPQYPVDTTCKTLGERDQYFPVTWYLFLLGFVVFLLYIVWPLYVLSHLVRKIYRDQDAYEANHEKFKYGEKSGQHDGDEKAEM